MVSIADLSALELIAKLPDDTPLRVEEAAVFLRMSKSALDKMRRPGHPNPGPAYTQGGGAGARGANQRVLYLKRDIRDWIEKNKTADTHQAAVRKGQLGFMTLQETAAEQAFWLNPNGRIAGLVDDTPPDFFFERIGKWEIEWFSPAEACAQEWASITEHRAMASTVSDALKTALEAVSAGLEMTMLGTETDKQLAKTTGPETLL